MDLVSRQIALHLLRDIVSRLDKLERTTTISTIGLSDAIESVLERRFIECLSQLSKVEGLPRVSVIKEVVNGREGYHLFVGENKYTIEMQVDLGHQQGVKRPSRPDFVIRPLSAGGKRKPIAVFCDGWKFHKSIIRDDAAKRTAIINSGNYWIWSIVSDDVDAAIACKSGDGLPDPYTTKSNRADMRPPPGLVGPPPGAFKRNAIAELIHWLSLPAVDADIWVQGAWAASIGWLMRLVPTTTEHSTFVQLTNRELRQRLPIWLPEPPSSSFEAALDGQRLFNIHGVWPASVHRDLARDVPSPNVVWFDDAAETDDAAKKAEWRWWLWAFNWLQTMPGSMLVTQSGVESQDYVGLNPANAESAVDIVLLPDEAAGWSDVLEQVVSSMTEDIRKLIGMRLPPPDEVGFPLEDESGEELSMAELTWLNQRVVVLAADFHADQGRWQANGWDAVISVGDWPNLVSGLLSESERSKQ
jgi:DEAD/DEAH box helicase domain-containing protein